ncbi:MAG: (2Fe-2S)-binding protein [Burkholderiales bacterium PBB5]|nr:MAG: (2Fe-2S)-binding protein [Burkholderiales bacterium PBB5]
MIVCLCNRVSDRDITAAVHQGTRCFEQLQDQTGVASCCGCCHDCARAVFDAACQGSAAAATPVHPVHVLRAAA